MNKCPQCDRDISSNVCVVCAIQVSAPTAEDFPPITWKEIRDHLVDRLMIDPEWMIEDEDEFTWWPGLVPQSILVSSRVEIDPDDIAETLIRVTIESVLGTAIERSEALEVVAELMIDYPFGSIVVLDDNRVVALASVALYGRNKSLFSLLHEEALVQATFAQDISNNLVEEGVIVTNHPIHPTSGRRDERDELIRTVYGNEKFRPLHPDLFPMRDSVRSYWRNSTLQTRGELGFENEDVTFITFEDRFDCGVGWRDDEFPSDKFGPSLMVWNNLAATRVPLSAEQMNSLNLTIALETDFGLGHIGGITQKMHESWNAISQIAVLPHYFLQTTEHKLEGGIITGFNAILQATACARYAHWLLHQETTSDN
jgi:hypothetical protein